MRQLRTGSRLTTLWLIIVSIGILYTFGLGFLQILDQIDKSKVATSLMVLWWVALLGLLHAAHKS